MAKKIFNFGERLALYEDLPANTQYNTMPEPNIENINNIIQYTGDTDQNYTNGYYYKCISDGQDPATYSWERVDVQPAPDMSEYEQISNKITSLSDQSTNTEYPSAKAVFDLISELDGANFEIIKPNDANNYFDFKNKDVGFYAGTSLKTNQNFYYNNGLQNESRGMCILYLIIVKKYDEAETNETVAYALAVITESSFVPGHGNGELSLIQFDKLSNGALYPTLSGSPLLNTRMNVLIDGAQGLRGEKTFYVLPKMNTYAYPPTLDTQLTPKKYVDDAIATAISSIETTKRLIVQELPTTDIATDTIYMVPKTTPGTQNVYDEYMYINNAWELIGSTEIDLTNYYTKAEVNAMIQNINDQIGNISEVLSHLTDPVIPIGTVLYTDDITADNGEGTYTVTTKEFHADSNYYVIDYTFTNTGSTAISGIVLDEYTTSTDSHLPLMADYQIEPGETITLTSYWQDSATYAATETAYQTPNNVTVSFDTTDNTTNYSVNVPLSGLGFSTDVVAHPNVYNSSDMGEGFVMTTFDRTGGTEDPYTVPEEFYVAWINQTNQTYATISAPISDTLTMTRSYLGFSTSQFDATNTKFFLIKTADIVDGTYQEFLDAYNAFINGGV